MNSCIAENSCILDRYQNLQNNIKTGGLVSCLQQNSTTANKCSMLLTVLLLVCRDSSTDQQLRLTPKTRASHRFSWTTARLTCDVMLCYQLDEASQSLLPEFPAVQHVSLLSSQHHLAYQHATVETVEK